MKIPEEYKTIMSKELVARVKEICKNSTVVCPVIRDKCELMVDTEDCLIPFLQAKYLMVAKKRPMEFKAFADIFKKKNTPANPETKQENDMLYNKEQMVKMSALIQSCAELIQSCADIIGNQQKSKNPAATINIKRVIDAINNEVAAINKANNETAAKDIAKTINAADECIPDYMFYVLMQQGRMFR